MIEKAPPCGLTLSEVLDRVLDKGIVIDARCHVSIAGAELVTVCSHVVVTSIDTHLKYLEDGVDREPRSPASRQSTPVVDFPAFLPDRSPFRP
jgi:hypothetical protein